MSIILGLEKDCSKTGCFVFYFLHQTPLNIKIEKEVSGHRIQPPTRCMSALVSLPDKHDSMLD